MREHHVSLLCCPNCKGCLQIAKVQSHRADRIEECTLTCASCPSTYPVSGWIPRFVPRENYASSFGLEWTRHAHTQYDSHSGLALSERRFFAETRWPRDLGGEVILEAGSGSGRFTEQAAATGAMVVSVDYSYAVEANYAMNGTKDNVLVIQGDIFALPFREAQFHRVFCFGVLQHTPDPEGALHCLAQQLRPGGELVVDIYIKSLTKYVLGTKYWVRPFTRDLPPERLYSWVRRYVDFMWPLASLLRRIPRFGPALNWRLLVADYSGLGLEAEMLKEWAYLDTFDMLAPRYDFPQTGRTLRRWLAETGLTAVEVSRGYNGLEGRGRRLPKAG